ncbi:MAG: hypothetical protein ACRD88_10410 [Terriglobia bacterium]
MFVFNASTLILLARAELLEKFLNGVGQPVAIPKEVERECCAVKQSLDALLIRKAVDEKRIRVIAVRNRKLVERLRGDFPLGNGEAEAIALAVSENASVIGIDDKQAINACKLLRIPFTTAVAILIGMHEKHLIPTDEALSKLEALGRFGRYKTAILSEARSKLEGEK